MYQNQASGRMIFTVKNDFMISALLVNPDRCMSVTISSNEKLYPNLSRNKIPYSENLYSAEEQA